NGTLQLSESIVASSTAYIAGGIINAGVLTLTDSIVQGNSAFDAGGLANGGLLVITNSLVVGNQARRDGGGGWNDSGIGLIYNSTISGNAACNSDCTLPFGRMINAPTYGYPSHGGGIDSYLGMLLIANSSILNNEVLYGNGAIHLYSPAEFSNVTISGNTDSLV